MLTIHHMSVHANFLLDII